MPRQPHTEDSDAEINMLKNVFTPLVGHQTDSCDSILRCWPEERHCHEDDNRVPKFIQQARDATARRGDMRRLNLPWFSSFWVLLILSSSSSSSCLNSLLSLLLSASSFFADSPCQSLLRDTSSSAGLLQPISPAPWLWLANLRTRHKDILKDPKIS